MTDIKDLQEKLRVGSLDRRQFLSAAAAIGVSAVVAENLFLSSSAIAATPRKGGSLRFATNMHGPDDQLDPIVCTSTIDYTRGHATYNGLIQILDNMKLHPELAEEWSSNSNATEFSFKIRNFDFSSEETCKKTSFPLSSSKVIKPYPFLELNHFTLPEGIKFSCNFEVIFYFLDAETF
mgnify:CR=1 FL=1